jgi:hypothetical protein
MPSNERENLDAALDAAYKADATSKTISDAVIQKWKRDGQPAPANLSTEGLRDQAIEGMRLLINSIGSLEKRVTDLEGG